VGHDGRGAANGRQYWPVGSGPNVAAHGVRNLASWAAAAALTYIRGRAPAASHTPPSLLPPNLQLSTSSERFRGMFSKFSPV
jgi:hypothetical protein